MLQTFNQRERQDVTRWKTKSAFEIFGMFVQLLKLDCEDGLMPLQCLLGIENIHMRKFQIAMSYLIQLIVNN